MHDLSLGGPVVVGRDPKAKHLGTCFDGVYGCHLCWNAANDGKGEIFTCDWCQKPEVNTLVLRSIDEPVHYAICEDCQAKRQKYANDCLTDDEYFGDYAADD